ncbi:MFS transporter [Lacticaseibacillus casei]|uniref:MFS transporter n=1 Tax=Lacticaseibacillus huelsenbergensis TaxID=3035291 RepID=A0ABY8DZD9_9LACO|nr:MULTISPECIES: MFS transporter [Lacticaseibacillus]MDG3062119.1 MFS transporter [Lacticaseibacillus sp. BCRC 81376]QVI36339.1 MFS transporter [Lacticaseibacillus casei]QXG58140.1 MFS transporter [Lacticaseibacillus casei]WFB40388.1 MFS transporter [Lacticaseibacillus huelsenbergensis]WFB42141.1 MFS transporter [Lacticaseibacillus huelsenbergensis]
MTKKNSVFALSIFIIGVFMSALDNGIISSALSTINYSFHVNEVQGTWAITLYTLGMAIATPIIGKLADKFGRRKLFLIEILIFAIGSLLVALSPSFIFFLGARLVQSIGGGGIFIIASSHILATYPKPQQGALLGALGAVNGIASVVGPNLGSLILNITGQWHWLFLINLPIAVFILISGFIAIPETKAAAIKGLDLKGLVFLTLGIFSMMLAITNLSSDQLLASVLTPQVWGLFLLSLAFFFGFTRIEKGIRGNVDPFLPYKLIKSPGFLLTLFMGLLSGALIAVFVFIPSFVEQRYGISANNSGVWMSGIGLGSIVGAGVGGMLVGKLGAIKSIIVSGTLSTIGFAMVAFLSPTTLWFIIASTVAGIGFGMLMGAPFSVLMSEIASQKDNGVALGTLSVSRQIGLTIAPTIYATLIQTGFSKLALKGGTASIESFYRGLQGLAASTHKNQLLQNFYAIAQQAYQNMFFLSVAASAIILLGGLYLQARHRKLDEIA